MIHPRRDLADFLSVTGPGRTLDLLLPPPELADAPCATTDPALFFPERGAVPAVARTICRACDVQAPCLDYALAAEGGARGHGMYGGLTPGERVKVARQRAAEAAEQAGGAA